MFVNNELCVIGRKIFRITIMRFTKNHYSHAVMAFVILVANIRLEKNLRHCDRFLTLRIFDSYPHSCIVPA